MGDTRAVEPQPLGAEEETRLRRHEMANDGVAWTRCRVCAATWPCLPARLLASLEAERRRRKQAERRKADYAVALDAERSRAVEAEQERDRLREALTLIRAHGCRRYPDGNCRTHYDATRCEGCTAWAALARSEPESRTDA